MNNIIRFNNIRNIVKFINSIKNDIYIITNNRVHNILFKYIKKIKFKSVVIIKDGEKNKRYSIVKNIISKLLKLKVNKNSIIISLGGGVIGDIIGFTTSITLRGLKHIIIPTTLLSQVDSSIGGKNGINLKIGKNLVGTIKQPFLNLIAAKFNKHLDSINYIEGLSEIIKISIINNKKLFNYIKEKTRKIKKRNEKILRNIIKKSITSKLKIVYKDYKETGLRMKLNLGHTIAHAIEKSTNHKISHGIAVFIGLKIINNISAKVNILKINKKKKIRSLIKNIINIKLNLKKINKKNILKFIGYDKKNINKKTNFIIIKSIGKVKILPFKSNLIKNILTKKNLNEKTIYKK